ncbi:hypothetical protein EPO17_00500 [Patescibacteria group bacterium]|nr:MAG: hypothetical protein EPO17_00500 [Patescibacteria group bacterium]
MKKHLAQGFLIVLIFFVSAVAFYHTSQVRAQGDVGTLSGYLWSSNIGWVSMNSSNDSGSAGLYGVAVQATGADGFRPVVGYGWSPNIGWIKFGGLSGFPVVSGGSGTVSANARFNSNHIEGWARACAGTIIPDCTGNTRIDGWDGWIALSGSTHPVIGTTDDSGNTWFRGFSWGSDVVGWLDWERVIGTNMNLAGPQVNLSLSETDSGETRLTTTERDRVHLYWKTRNLPAGITQIQARAYKQGTVQDIPQDSIWSGTKQISAGGDLTNGFEAVGSYYFKVQYLDSVTNTYVSSNDVYVTIVPAFSFSIGPELLLKQAPGSVSNRSQVALNAPASFNGSVPLSLVSITGPSGTLTCGQQVTCSLSASVSRVTPAELELTARTQLPRGIYTVTISGPADGSTIVGTVPLRVGDSSATFEEF